MKNRTLTLPIIGIALLTAAAIFTWPKLTGGQEKTSNEFVPLTAEMPHHERVRPEKEDEDPVRVHFGLRVVTEQRQTNVQETTDLLNK